MLSFLLFGISVILLIAWTVSESAFTGMSVTAERIITFAILVLPAGIGAVLGVMSLLQREGKTGLAMTGVVLNTLFALFHLMVALFAG
jgi:Mg2+/citrate symporter